MNKLYGKKISEIPAKIAEQLEPKILGITHTETGSFYKVKIVDWGEMGFIFEYIGLKGKKDLVRLRNRMEDVRIDSVGEALETDARKEFYGDKFTLNLIQ